MRLKVEHTTTFQYDQPVYETSTEVRLRPAEEIIAPQRLVSFDIRTDPNAPLAQYVDYFGNWVYNFNLLQQHKGLRITSTAVVETGQGRTKATPDDEIRAQDFLHESRFVHFDSAVREFASAGVCGLSSSPLSVAECLCREINETFTYEPGVTDVQSPSSDVIQLKRGVCQDFAHVLIAACRVRGISARYVSGYLYGGALTERDDRASHAWSEVYAGPDLGWIGLDPTHETMFVDERYVKLGVGRDYSDVPPVRGAYKGMAIEAMQVVVRVTEV